MDISSLQDTKEGEEDGKRANVLTKPAYDTNEFLGLPGSNHSSPLVIDFDQLIAEANEHYVTQILINDVLNEDFNSDTQDSSISYSVKQDEDEEEENDNLVAEDSKENKPPLKRKGSMKVEVQPKFMKMERFYWELKDANDRIGNKFSILFESQPDGRFLELPLSYTCLITLAVNSNQSGRMPVSEMYQYLEQNFPFYAQTKRKWRNSLRHNLCHTKNFVKTEDKKSEKKGYFWAVGPGRLPVLEKEIVARRITSITQLHHTLGSKGALQDLIQIGLLAPEVSDQFLVQVEY